MPHRRGDEPIATFLKKIDVIVCPTGVGMNRSYAKKIRITSRMPHRRGDEPLQTTGIKRWPKRMPHRRGDEPYRKLEQNN